MSSINRNMLLGGVGATAALAMGVKTMLPGMMDDVKTVRLMNKVTQRALAAIQDGMYIIDKFEAQAAMNPNKTYMIFQDRRYSYGMMNEMANRVANVAKAWDLKPGDVVATMISNGPAFLWTFLGLLKIGVTNAFVNHRLSSKPLVNSIKVSEAKVLILGAGDKLLESVLSKHNELPAIPMYVMGKAQSDLPEGFLSFDDVIFRAPPAQFLRHIRSHVVLTSPMCYMYTSGTTGYPKPVIMNHAKVISISKVSCIFNATKDDVMYIVTPFHHASAFNVAIMCIDKGATLVTRERFSASHFWEDVRKHNVTVIFYIGELLRYLLANQKSSLDGVHKVRAAVGNGLRQDIWEQFQKRFKIPKIIEFFAATEGPSSLFNVSNKVGSVGRWSPFMDQLSIGGTAGGGRFIRYDPIEDVPYRDKTGMCKDISPGQEGMFIAPLPPIFTGLYKGPAEMTEKKILRDVFVQGDAYFSYGDILYMDKDYWIYFRDRVGDTFRWKGENVSTREVCDVISELDFIHDVNVYGVKVPGLYVRSTAKVIYGREKLRKKEKPGKKIRGERYEEAGLGNFDPNNTKFRKNDKNAKKYDGTEGRAGMAALSLKENIVMNPELLHHLYRKCEKDLPSYARPLFIRIQKEFVMTQTFKQRKNELVADGFDPDKISEQLFFMDREKKTYVPLLNINQVLDSKL